MLVLKKIEQWLNLKFLVKLGKSRTKINEMLPMVCGKDTLKSVTVYKWMKHFQEGHEDIGDDVLNGQPSASHTEENVDQVRVLVLAN